MRTGRWRTQTSLVRMARLLVPRCMRLGLDTASADMASFPRTEAFLQKHSLIREHISHCLWTLMSLAATKARKQRREKTDFAFKNVTGSLTQDRTESIWNLPSTSKLIPLILNSALLIHLRMSPIGSTPPLSAFPLMFPPPASLSHYCYCREQSQSTILPRTLLSLISSFTDMALLTTPMALVPQEGLKCQLPLAERLQTV